MTTPDKRRSGSHAIRASAASRNASVIAPPPRAQLTGSASSSTSAGQEAEGAHEPGVGSSSNNISSSSISNSNKDGAGTSSGSGSGSGGGGGGKGKEGALLLREKDERIAGLERELAVMEAEFTRELDRLSQNESETASFWQRKHSALNQQFLRADTELRLLRAEADAREAERRALRDARDAELAQLRAHLSGMKQWVSASTRADQQASDDEFADAAAKLANGLQNWVIVHFRRAKLGMDPSRRPRIYRYIYVYTRIAYL